MKVFLAVILLFAIGARAIPVELPPQPLSPVVETEIEDGPESPPENWALVPDGDGNFHFVDLNEDTGPDTFFNAATDVIFRVFTRANPTTGQIITLNNAASLSNSNFNSNNPTRFIIHGWNNNGGSTVNTAIRSAYITRGTFNVITVDWGAGANSNYLTSRNRVGAVGAVVAQFIDFLNLSGGMPFTSLAITGHSLGAHIAGMAGKRTTRGRVGAIIGMDPALPLFSEGSPTERLHSTDAVYTETLHTNAGLLGFNTPITLASFYPNFGSSQPGCGVDITGNCAHGRAHQFFSESINSSAGFWSRQCRNYNDILNGNCVSAGANRVMAGEPPNTASRGVFWLQTNSNSPFARGPM